jgi:hypothetical protein
MLLIVMAVLLFLYREEPAPEAPVAAAPAMNACDGFRALVHVELSPEDLARAHAEELLGHPGARIVPSLTDGAARGFKLYAVRRGSLWDRLGARNGDVILWPGTPPEMLDFAGKLPPRLVLMGGEGCPRVVDVKVRVGPGA